MALGVLVLLLTAAPAAAAPTYAGNVDRQFTWSGGPLTGANIAGEPCGPTRGCEDVLLKFPIAGTAKVKWSARSPVQQGWLGAQVYKAGPGGVPTGDPVKESSGLSNDGVISWSADAGDYVVTMSSLLSVAATYDGTATIEPDADDVPVAPTPVAPAPAPAPAANALPSAVAVNGVVSRKGTLGVRLGCRGAGGCAGAATLVVARRVAGRVRYRLPAGATARYTIKVRSSVVRKLKGRAAISATLKLTATGVSKPRTVRLKLHR